MPAPPPEPEPLLVGLITKTESNPFFVTMKEAAIATAAELGVELRTFSGRSEGDLATQIEAVGTLVASGARGILITPSDPEALAAAVSGAREAGVLVLALDTPFDPADTVDGTFATDNFRAGELTGRWARERLGAAAADARIATLDISAAQITVDVLRNQGFLHGFGIAIGDPKRKYDERDPRLVGSGESFGSEAGGFAAMEALLAEHPDINLVHTINEPAAAGARGALEAAGRAEDVLLVSVDGACSGVRNVASGTLHATAMQFPVRMASLGVEAVVRFVETGERPENSPGLDFHDTGVALVTDASVPAVASISSAEGLEQCWE